MEKPNSERGRLMLIVRDEMTVFNYFNGLNSEFLCKYARRDRAGIGGNKGLRPRVLRMESRGRATQGGEL
jgi:hypothetical protein